MKRPSLISSRVARFAKRPSPLPVKRRERRMWQERWPHYGLMWRAQANRLPLKPLDPPRAEKRALLVLPSQWSKPHPNNLYSGKNRLHR
jgi:hypothetical protein